MPQMRDDDNCLSGPGKSATNNEGAGAGKSSQAGYLWPGDQTRQDPSRRSGPPDGSSLSKEI